MDFGKILDSWESKNDEKQSARDDLKQWLDRNEIPDKDSNLHEIERDKQERIRQRSVFRNLEPQAQIDLHGSTKDEALQRLEDFLYDSHKKGLQKVLIIHGKGLHSQEVPVLGKAVRQFLEKSPLAGEMGTAEKQYGGTGAMWVKVRYRSL